MTNNTELNKMTDFELIQFMISDNKAVIEFVFYEKCKPLFAYIVREIFSNRVQKNELVSELYIYLKNNNWQIIKDFQGRSKLTTWLSVVAVRFFLKKRAFMIENVSQSALNNDIREIKSDLNSQDEMIRKMDLINAIHSLKSPRDRYIILSLEIEGCEADLVAQELNITKANLYNIKKRAFEKLSNLLIDYKL